jgi:hypothetical protein
VICGKVEVLKDEVLLVLKSVVQPSACNGGVGCYNSYVGNEGRSPSLPVEVIAISWIAELISAPTTLIDTIFTPRVTSSAADAAVVCCAFCTRSVAVLKWLN